MFISLKLIGTKVSLTDLYFFLVSQLKLSWEERIVNTRFLTLVGRYSYDLVLYAIQYCCSDQGTLSIKVRSFLKL